MLRRDLAAQASIALTKTLLDQQGGYAVVIRLTAPAQQPLHVVSLHARPARYDGALPASALPTARSCEADPW